MLPEDKHIFFWLIRRKLIQDANEKAKRGSGLSKYFPISATGELDTEVIIVTEWHYSLYAAVS